MSTAGVTYRLYLLRLTLERPKSLGRNSFAEETAFYWRARWKISQGRASLPHPHSGPNPSSWLMKHHKTFESYATVEYISKYAWTPVFSDYKFATFNNKSPSNPVAKRGMLRYRASIGGYSIEVLSNPLSSAYVPWEDQVIQETIYVPCVFLTREQISLRKFFLKRTHSPLASTIAKICVC